MANMLTISQVAERLHASRRQVEYHIEAGALPVIDIGRGSQRRALRIDESDLQRFIDARRSTTSPSPAAPKPRPTAGRPRTSATSASDVAAQLLASAGGAA